MKNNAKPQEHASGMTLNDIYFVLFRHKWSIIILTLLGFVGAGAVYALKQPPYESEAKLLIRFVMESKSPTPGADPSQMKSPDGGGQNIINSEMEILSSLDLADKVVDAIGAEKILAKAGGGKDRNRAAAVVNRNLQVESSQKSSVIRITFSHPDPDIVQPVLQAIIDSYLKKHVEIHRGTGMFGDFLTQETDQLRAELAQTEEELKKAKSRIGVTSMDDAKKSNQDQITRISQELYAAEAEFAEQQGTIRELMKYSSNGSNDTEVKITVDPKVVVDYSNLNDQLDSLRKQEQERRMIYTEQNQLVKEIRDRIKEVEDHKCQLESENPALAAYSVAPLTSNKGDGIRTAPGALRMAALGSKIKVLNGQLQRLRTEGTNIDEIEPLINELQLKKQLKEANFRSFSSSLQQSRIDEALGAGKVTNISSVQEPSPPYQNRNKFYKMLFGVMAGGFGAGLTWAFLFEMYIDTTIKRGKDIESKLGLRPFLIIPDVSRNGHRRAAANGGYEYEDEAVEVPVEADGKKSNGKADKKSTAVVRAETAAWDSQHAMHPYHEVLCDRLLSYFEAQNLTRKPKLMAVTSTGKSAGASTVAMGMAASLSKTGDGKVLVVDMNPNKPTTHQFFKGKPGFALEDVLKDDRRNEALVENNLYIVAEGKETLLPRVLPRRIADLLPRLKASDYDYIIFDMPAVNQTNSTLRVAGLMDVVLLVAEAEKTSRAALRRANEQLKDAQANVKVVLNKTHEYIPERLNQDS